MKRPDSALIPTAPKNSDYAEPEETRNTPCNETSRDNKKQTSVTFSDCGMLPTQIRETGKNPHPD